MQPLPAASLEVSHTSVDVHFSDGSRAALQVYQRADTKGDPNAPVILFFPALGVAASYYESMARHFALSKGWIVALTEQRGIGRSSVRPSRGKDWGYFTLVAMEMPAYVKQVTELFPANPLLLFGHSLGGQLIGLYLSWLLLTGNKTTYSRILGAVTIGAPNLHWRLYGFSILLFALAVRLLCWILGYHRGAIFNFGGNQPRTLMRDWSTSPLFGSWRLTGTSLDLDGGLASIDKPLLLLSIRNDYYAPPGCVEGYAKKLSKADVNVMHLSAGELSDHLRKVDNQKVHFRWAKHPEGLAPIIDQWLRPRRQAELAHRMLSTAD